MLPRIIAVCKKRRPRKKGMNLMYNHITYRGAKIQNEVITSHKKNVEIEWIWNDLEEKEECEELAKVITATILTSLKIGH